MRLLRKQLDEGGAGSVVVDPAGEAAEEEASLAEVKLHTLIGHVRDPAGKPLVGMRIYPKGIESELNAMTDRDGTFILENLPSNRRRLLLALWGFESQRELAPSDREEMDITFKSTPGTKSSRGW